MKHHPNKEINKLFAELVSQGWIIDKHRGHFHLTSPTGQKLTASGSPKNAWTTVKQIERDIRRYCNREKE